LLFPFLLRGGGDLHGEVVNRFAEAFPCFNPHGLSAFPVPFRFRAVGVAIDGGQGVCFALGVGADLLGVDADPLGCGEELGRRVIAPRLFLRLADQQDVAQEADQLGVEHVRDALLQTLDGGPVGFFRVIQLCDPEPGLLVQAPDAELGEHLQIGGGKHQKRLAADFLEEAGTELVFRLQRGLLLGLLFRLLCGVPCVQLDAGGSQCVRKSLFLDDFEKPVLRVAVEEAPRVRIVVASL